MTPIRAAALVFSLFLVPAVLSRSVTYPGLGTYDSNDFYHPIHRPYTRLFVPASPQSQSPTFTLYTPTNADTPDDLKFNDTASIESSHFDGSLPTKVFVHGYMDSVQQGKWMRDLKDLYLQWEATNVILVDWSRSNRPPYGQATVNARVIGAMIGVQIQALIRTKAAAVESFHVLGHSLGAHVAGYAGKFLAGQIGRVTGLDAAGPYFSGTVPEARIWATDARFVDAIHTEASATGFGMFETYADVDFYPNGGLEQPGCKEEKANPAKYSPDDQRRTQLVCDHARAADFYLDSVNRSIVLPKAYQCDSFKDFQNGKCVQCGADGSKCALMGVRAVEYQSLVATPKSPTTNGKRWFLVTDLHRPTLSKYQYDISFNSSSGAALSVASVVPKSITGFNTAGNSDSFAFDSKSSGGSGLAGVLSIDPLSLERITLSAGSVSSVSTIKVIGFTTSTSTSESPAMEANFCKSSTNIGTYNKC